MSVNPAGSSPESRPSASAGLPVTDGLELADDVQDAGQRPAPTGAWCEASTVRVSRGSSKQRWKRQYRGPRFLPEGKGPQGPGWLPPDRENRAVPEP